MFVVLQPGDKTPGYHHSVATSHSGASLGKSRPKSISVIVAIEYEYRLTPEQEYELMTEQTLRKAQIAATPMF